ncbi:MAG: DEAD/DEAH box helicase, partial [Chloroflexi bacterium]|nr:DEAD/DEAH box helicase [Chloroflexota bacterium]
MSLPDLLQRWRTWPTMARSATDWRRLPRRAARYAPLPAALDQQLLRALQTEGVRQLYSHQAAAFQAAAAGQHLVVSTPTASGKTLCYNLPVLQTLLQEPQARALYLFPTKALAQDQLAALGRLTAEIDAPLRIDTYDGDTPAAARRSIREGAAIVVSNPDMLHTGILPHHTRWAAFFSGLRYVVIDELHTYRGLFGSHVANVLRRLQRVAAFYGARPQFICSSATIANPQALAERLVEAPFTLVDDDGSPSGEKHFVLYNPPLVNRELGIRRSPMLDARALAGELLAQGVQTAVFARSRLATEVLLTYLRDFAASQGWPAERVRGYRGGYLPEERRAIERGLREGEVWGVVATNALELGVDIGQLAACLMVGYPGTIASTW